MCGMGDTDWNEKWVSSSEETLVEMLQSGNRDGKWPFAAEPMQGASGLDVQPYRK